MQSSNRNGHNLRLRFGALSVCMLLLGAGRLFSQADTGSITGTATDPAGAVLPGAKITIIAVATNRRQSYLTDSEGRYSSGPLRVGEYEIDAELTGFKRLVRRSILIQVQQTAVINLQLELGTVTQETTVTAAPDLVGPWTHHRAR